MDQFAPSNSPLSPCSKRSELVARLRVLIEGWTTLAAAHSALAHSCIVSLTVRSKKFAFLVEGTS